MHAGVSMHACKRCRDAVILQHQYEMPGSGVRYSVFDNLLIAHMGHSGRAQIIDVSGGSTPVSAAQPFARAAIRGALLEGFWVQWGRRMHLSPAPKYA